MNTQLLVTIIFKLLDLGVRLSDTPEDVEAYIELRNKLRKELVNEANTPFGEGDTSEDSQPEESEDQDENRPVENIEPDPDEVPDRPQDVGEGRIEDQS